MSQPTLPAQGGERNQGREFKLIRKRRDEKGRKEEKEWIEKWGKRKKKKIK